jgi:AraC-like DNA-binding protein/uncharacterized RmlC-like cupin family protein
MTIHTGIGEHDANAKPGLVCGVHYHDEIELLVVVKGEMRFTVDGKSYNAKAGEIIFVNSGVPHASYRVEAPVQSGIIQFKESDFIDSENLQIISYSSKLKSISEIAVAVIRNPEFFEAAINLISESKKRDIAYDMFIRSEIYRILGFLYRGKYLVEADDIKNNREAQKILPLLSYINANYHENITLESASAMLNFDPSYFCRIFKLATGATFTEYLNFARICNAERMLAKSDKSILEISEAVGFSSVSYFNRIFKKYKNCSPRFYRSAKHGENI